VRLDGVVSLIDQFPALAGVDLDVAEGSLILVRGPNGAGKSTLLRLCAGLASLDAGTASILGHDLATPKGRRLIRRETGLLAHQTFLYDELTVHQNLHFWSQANRVDPAVIPPILDRLGLSGRLLDVPAANLSAGQRRRTSLAVLICRRPRLWLLDEPHAGLDQAGRELVDELMGEATEAGATVLVASHDTDRVRALVDRTVTVVGGRIIDPDRDQP
jgi:heme ABC exporter ATP-binding subunit CcmA